VPIGENEETFPGRKGETVLIDPAAVGALREEPLDWRFKAAPLWTSGTTVTVGECLSRHPSLAGFGTPLFTLERRALDHNIATMAGWVAAAGVSLAPHGKSTMAPALWQRQLDADPGFSFSCWTDSARSVAIMDAALREAGAGRPVDVCVELGAPGGRTGVRDAAEAVAIANAVRAAPTLRLTGIAGYEGALGHDASAASLGAVDDFLKRMAALHGELSYEVGEPIVTAGGSAYFDQVVEVLGGLGARLVLRSGAYVVHDDGFYRAISPFSRGTGPGPLRPAMHGWARVVSRPEPALALLDAGKRDLPFDEGLPEPQAVRGRPGSALDGARVTALNDQLTFLAVEDGSDLACGDVVRLGLSHPCTAFDKWTLIPVIDDIESEDPQVVDLVRTYF
jgi:D-serine deaminase-like pyridoxal phosphate-dependent protein